MNSSGTPKDRPTLHYLSASLSERESLKSPLSAFVYNALEDDTESLSTTMTHNAATTKIMPHPLKSLATVIGLTLVVIVGTILNPLYTVINTSFAGKLSTDELASYGFGSMTIGISAIGISITFNAGMLTLAS